MISGEKEALYAAQGILLGFPNAEGVICDLGGNSVEFANIRKGLVTDCNSALLGPLSIKKLGKKFEGLDSYIRSELLRCNKCKISKRQTNFLNRRILESDSKNTYAEDEVSVKDYPRI